MIKKAIIQLEKDSQTRGVVKNVIELALDTPLGFTLPEHHLLWDCGQYPVAIGDRWNDGVFTRDDEPLSPLPTPEDRISDLETQNTSLEESMCNMDIATITRLDAIEEALCEMDLG